MTTTTTTTLPPVNHAPVASDDVFSVIFGKSLSVAGPGVIANDSYADGNWLLAMLVSQPSYGTLQFNSDGSFTYAAEAPMPASKLNAVVKWSWTSSSTLPDSLNVLMAPIVIDLNGDGIPEVVFGSTDSRGGGNIEIGNLRALRGDTGAEVFTVTDELINVASTIAAGDINGDGKPEIIACDASGKHLVAFGNDGSLKWRSPELEDINWSSPALADLNGDGLPEIIIGRQVLSHNGSLLWTGTRGRSPLAMVADIDLDGKPEIVSGNTAYNADGTVKWQAPLPDGGFNAVGNFDDDQFPEIVLVAAGQVWLMEHDGTVKWGPVNVPGLGNGGPPTVADVDGDGKPEIGVAGAYSYAVLNGDGTMKWGAATQDGSSNVTGSSVFDFEGDGSAEVIYRDELTLRVYRGKDGAVLYETPMSSCTWLEYPLVSDVDADGHAEIVAGANDSCGYGAQRGVYVLGDAATRWVPTRRIWNQHTYHVTNINEDGTVPQAEAVNWLIPGLNNFRLNTFGLSDLARTDSFTYKVSDGQLESNIATVVISAAKENHPPQIVSSPVTTATSGKSYLYYAQASDPDVGDVVVFSLSQAPAGMSIVKTTGVVQWTPTTGQAGTHDVVVEVKDTGGLTASQGFTVTVSTP